MSIVGPGVVPADNQHLLENEKDKGYEYGIKTNFNDSEFSGTMSVYSDERNGYVQLDFVKSINDPRNQGSNITTTQAQSSINGGIQRAEGMEWDLTWTPNRNLQLIANYAWQYTAKIVSDKTLNPATPGALVNQNFKRRLIKSPKNRANFIGKYNFTSGAMQGTSIGGAMHLTDPYYVTAGPANWIIVPRMTVFDLFATYSTQFFNVPTNFQLNAINLTNNINDITRGNGLELRLTTGFKF